MSTNVYHQTATFFPGVIDEVTDAVNESRLQSSFPLSTTENVIVVSAWVRRGKMPAVGSTTTVKIADAEWDGTATDTITLTLNADEWTCVPVTGEIPITAGNSVSIYFTGAGEHADLEIALEYKSVLIADTAGTGLYPETVISMARVDCADAVSSYRCEDGTFRGWLALAQSRIMRTNPDTRLSSSPGALTTIPDTVAAGEPMALGYDWLEALIHYCVYRFKASVDPDMADPLGAAWHMDQFKKAIGEA